MQRAVRENLRAFATGAVCICGITVWEEYRTASEALESIAGTYLGCLCSGGITDTVDAMGDQLWLIVLVNDYSY